MFQSKGSSSILGLGRFSISSSRPQSKVVKLRSAAAAKCLTSVSNSKLRQTPKSLGISRTNRKSFDRGRSHSSDAAGGLRAGYATSWCNKLLE